MVGLGVREASRLQLRLLSRLTKRATISNCETCINCAQRYRCYPAFNRKAEYVLPSNYRRLPIIGSRVYYEILTIQGYQSHSSVYGPRLIFIFVKDQNLEAVFIPRETGTRKLTPPPLLNRSGGASDCPLLQKGKNYFFNQPLVD